MAGESAVEAVVAHTIGKHEVDAARIARDVVAVAHGVDGSSSGGYGVGADVVVGLLEFYLHLHVGCHDH